MSEHRATIDSKLFVKTYMEAYTHGKSKYWVIEQLAVTPQQYKSKLEIMRSRGVVLPRLKRGSTKAPAHKKERVVHLIAKMRKGDHIALHLFYETYKHHYNEAVLKGEISNVSGRIAKDLGIKPESVRRHRSVFNKVSEKQYVPELPKNKANYKKLRPID